MRVIDQDTGKPYYLDRTAELNADFAAFEATRCKHENVAVRQRKDGGGASHYYRQCIECGQSVGTALKKSVELLDSPPWEVSKEDRYIAAREADRVAIYQKHVRKQRDREGGFQRKYDLYLSSPEWQARRQKVLQRAGGICEGCLEAKATQVHHKTYENIGNEFLFELVAICEPCHKRLHSDKHDLQELVPDAPEMVSEWELHYPCDGCRHQGEHKNHRWCHISDKTADEALASIFDCGPKRQLFEPLR